MAIFYSVQATTPRDSVISACGFEPFSMVGDFTIPSSFVSGDIVEMVCLPSGYVATDVVVDVPASLGTTMTADVGLMSGVWGNKSQSRTQGAEFMTGKAFGTAGIYRADRAGSLSIAPSVDAGSGVPNERSIGIKFTNVTNPIAGSKVRLVLTARPAYNGA